MPAKTPAKKHSSAGLKIGLSAAAIAAAAGAYYFFNGPDGKKHRRDAKAWATKAKKDLIVELKKLGNVSEKSYGQAAAAVIAKYKKFQKEHPEEFAKLSKELKGRWNEIQKHLPKNGAQAVRRARVAIKSLSSKRKIPVKSK